jgi:hypothetical protein
VLPEVQAKDKALRANGKTIMSESEPELCAICGKPLFTETWIDDEEYGDVHERCLRDKEEGRHDQN